MITDLVVSCSCGAKNRVMLAKLGALPRCGKCSEALPALSMILDLDDSSFEETLAASALPVMVDFWATWCPPCRSFAPTLEKFARESAGSVLVAKVDVDAARGTASKFQVSGVPTIVLFRDGREALRHVGALSLTALQRMVESSA